jgi:hypothetical protein
VPFSQGSRFGGHAPYVKDGRLAYAYNFAGQAVQVMESDQRIPTGSVVLSASFEREGQRSSGPPTPASEPFSS